jgi:signal transduction histidine kinase
MIKSLQFLFFICFYFFLSNKLFSQTSVKQDSSYHAILKINNDSLKKERIAVYAFQLVLDRLPRAKTVTEIMINDAINSNDNVLLAKIYGNCGYGYLLLGNYNAAYPIYLAALKVHQKIDQPSLLIKVHQDLMWIQVQLKELEAAEKSINTALELSKKRNLKLKEAESYNLKGVLFDSQGKFPLAILSYKESLKLNDQFGTKLNQFSTNVNLGISYRRSKQYAEALECFKKAETIGSSLTGVYNAKQSIVQNLAELSYETKDYDAAEKYILEALKNSKGNNELAARRGLFQNLKNIYAAKGEYQKAYNYSDSIAKVEEQVFSKDKLSDIRNLQIKYETQIKDQKIEKQELLNNQQKQQLAINFDKLVLSEQQKQIQKLSFFNRQSQLENDKQIQQAMLQRTALEVQIDKSKSTQEIEIQKSKLKANQRLLMGLLILTIVILIIAYFIYKTNLKTKKLNALILAQKSEIEKINAVKDQIFGIIGHDLRAPINTLMSFCTILDHDLSLDKMRLYANQIKGTLDYTSNLMTNLLNWANSQMQGYQPQLETQTIFPIVNQAIDVVKDLADKKSISIIADLSIDITAKLDVNMFELVLRNLLINAIKFTPNGGKISISLKQLKNEVKLILTDTGKGLSLEQVHQLNNQENAQPFHSSLGTNNEKGTGLGLVLSKTFLNLMNGSITVQSKLGEGSIFQISLPTAA